MPRFLFLKYSILCCLFTMAVVNISAQALVTNNGCVVYVNEQAVVKVNGDFNTINDSLTNQGLLIVSGIFKNDGLVLGNGYYEVFNDFINNKNFKPGRSRVTLNGTNQLITGGATTTFFDLVIKDTIAPFAGVKRLQKNISILNVLHLNNCELAGDDYNIFILNFNRLAIKRGDGFISNTGNGKLYREMNVTYPYLFPVGSSVGVKRYRPVEITPATTDSSVFAVRMVNNNADIDGYNRSQMDTGLCHLNPEFYHLIDHNFGTDSADVVVYYDDKIDGAYWNTIANWRPAVLPLWKSINPTKAVFYPSIGIMKSKLIDFTSQPFILAQMYPDSIPVSGFPFVCTDVLNPPYYTAWGGEQSIYNWSISGGTFALNDSTSQIVHINWEAPGYHTIYVTAKYPTSYCPTDTSSFLVYVNPKPVADFTVTSEFPQFDYFANDLISFVNTSTNDSLSSWQFNDGYTSSQKSPYHMFDAPGSYNVLLHVVSDSGCTDTISKIVIIHEGIFIPNVFTPNADGENDLFIIRNSGLTEYSLVIYDRWGVVVYESVNGAMHWDGRTRTGKEAAEGTYYYVLQAKTDSEDINKKGYLSLIR